MFKMLTLPSLGISRSCVSIDSQSKKGLHHVTLKNSVALGEDA